MFYVAPLFLIALLAWIERGAAAAAHVPPASPPSSQPRCRGVLPYRPLIGTPAESDTLALLPLVAAAGRTIPARPRSASSRSSRAPRRGLFAARSAPLCARAAARRRVWFVARDRSGSMDSTTASARVRRRALPGHHDRASRLGRPRRRPGRGRRRRLFRPDRAQPLHALGERVLQPQRRAGLLPAAAVDGRAPGDEGAAAVGRRPAPPDGRPVRSGYVLTDTSVPLAGKVIGLDEVRGTVLRRTPDGLVAIASRVAGTFPDGWSGRTVDLHAPALPRRERDGRRGERRQALLATADGERSRSQRHVRSLGRRDLTVPLKPTNGVCRVTFTVTPTAIPALVQPGNSDSRRLGARFIEFAYRGP